MHRLVSFALASLLSACVHIEQYPASWGHTIVSSESNGCPLLTGTYQNKGEKPGGEHVYLATWLEPKTGAENREERLANQEFLDDLFKARTVDLVLSNDILTVTANGDNIHRQWSFDRSKESFVCRSGVLTISRGGNMSGDNVAAIGSGATDLYRTDSHLVVNSHGVTAGIILLIPAAGYGSDWARFILQKP